MFDADEKIEIRMTRLGCQSTGASCFLLSVCRSEAAIRDVMGHFLMRQVGHIQGFYIAS